MNPEKLFSCFPDKQHISPKEKAGLIFFILIFVMLTAIPLLIGHVKETPNAVFTGLIGKAGHDMPFYLSWGPCQAARGEWLFEDKLNGYTERRLVFHPLWLAMGKIAQITGMSCVWIYHIQRILFSIGFIWICYGFMARLFDTPPYRFFATALVVFGSGLGAFFPGASIPDTWIIEMNIFLIMLGEVILPAAVVLLFLAIEALFDAGKKADKKNIGRLCLWSCLLSWTYPYAMINILLITGVSLAISALISKNSFKDMLLAHSPIVWATGLGVLPALTYDTFLVVTRPALVEGQGLFASPNPIKYLLAFGILAPFFILQMIRIGKGQDRHLRLISIWAVLSLTQIYLPLPFQMQLILNVQIPVTILAVHYLVLLLNSRPKRIQVAVCLCIFMFTLPTNLLNFKQTIAHLDASQLPEFLPAAHLKVLKWMDKHTDNHDVVLAAAFISPYIPLYSRNRVYTSDSGAPSADFTLKRKILHDLCQQPNGGSEEAWLSFFRQYRINRLLVDHYLVKEIGSKAIQRLERLPFITIAFQYGDVRCYSIKSGIG